MQDQNLVLVVDDDPGILKGVQRLLRQHAYEPILFSSAEAFKNHTDFEGAACVILDINLKDGSGIDLGYRLKADRRFTSRGIEILPSARLHWTLDASRF